MEACEASLSFTPRDDAALRWTRTNRAKETKNLPFRVYIIHTHTIDIQRIAKPDEEKNLFACTVHSVEELHCVPERVQSERPSFRM